MRRAKLWEEQDIIKDGMKLRSGMNNYPKEYLQTKDWFARQYRKNLLGWDDILKATVGELLGKVPEDRESLQMNAIELACISIDLCLALEKNNVIIPLLERKEKELKQESENEDRTEDTA